MRKKEFTESGFNINYFNPTATLITILVITIGITRPLSGEGLFDLLKQRWFYAPLGETFVAMSCLFLIVGTITSQLDERWRWEKHYGKRALFQALFAWMIPSIIIAFISWGYSNTLGTKVMLDLYTWSMFLVLLAIALFINVFYILYYFYRFVKHMAVVEKEGEATEEVAFFHVPDGKGQKKIPIAEIAYVFSEDGNTILKTLSDINYPLDQSLDAVEMVLEPKHFHKVNRNYIISHVCYVSMKKDGDNRMLITLDPPANIDVVVSRGRITGTRQWINEDPTIV